MCLCIVEEAEDLDSIVHVDALVLFELDDCEFHSSLVVVDIEAFFQAVVKRLEFGFSLYGRSSDTKVWRRERDLNPRGPKGPQALCPRFQAWAP